MHWEFDRKASGGLRAIRQIPDIHPCLIEGRNGVGKTVAVQLLQLASGQLPNEFARQSQLWTSLKKHLGQTRIIVTDLEGADRVEFTFTPDDWPDEADVLSNTLGTCRIDGVDARRSDFIDLFHVERIVGNEDLATTIGRHRDLLEAQLTAVQRRISARLASVEGIADELVEDLRRTDPAHLEQDTQIAAEAELEERAAREEVSSAAERLQLLSTAQELLRKRDTVDGDAETLLARRDEALTKTKDLETRLADAQTAADDLAERLGEEGGLSQQLAQAGKTRRIRHDRLEKLVRSTTRDARSLGLEPDPDTVNDALADCSNELDAAQLAQRQLDTAGQVRSVIDDVIPVVSAVLRDLPKELLADGFTPALTVSAAHAGLNSRRDTLANEPTPTQTREIAATITSLTRRRTALENLATDLGKLSRAQELVKLADEEYSDLEERSVESTQLAKDSRAADETVGRLQGELNAAHEALADLGLQLQTQGTMSREDADADIRDAVTRLGVAETDLLISTDRFRRELAAAEERMSRADRLAADARRRLTARRTELARTIGRLRTEERFAWLRDLRPLTTDDGQPDVEAYGQVRTAVLNAIDAIGEAERTVATLQGLCRQFMDSRPPGGSELDGSNELARPFATMLSSRMVNALNSDSIRERVFDGGRAVELDPVNRNITLQWESGASDVRAMASFSTGEQAFAFTQARISDLQPSPKPNRLLVLDEFGAFVSADRMPELAAFLTTDAVARVADQVLIILPLQVNYEVEIANTRGALREQYAERLAQIEERDYCAVALR